MREGDQDSNLKNLIEHQQAADLLLNALAAAVSSYRRATGAYIAQQLHPTPPPVN